LRAGFQPVLLASIAAALSWVITHNVLGHAQPFFAPIAAAISLSTSSIQRSRRIVQLVAGVLLGIAVGEALAALLGTTSLALGLIVLLTFSAALISGEGVFGEGMMFANQAAASAILVVTLHRAGTGSERVVDALVGGGVALVLGVILFPAHPMRLLTNAEDRVLRAAADLLDEITTYLRSGTAPPPGWALENGQHIHQLLAGLAQARSTARTNVRVAPRRFPLRAIVDAEAERTARLDLLGNAALSLMRAASAAEERGEHVGEALTRDIAGLAVALHRLVPQPRPWSPEVVAEIHAAARQISDRAAAGGVEESPVITAVIRAMANDLEDVVATPGAPAPARRNTAAHPA
jgi:uncharacterized membrane protein YgaE (UPF0421/DUF939 family)